MQILDFFTSHAQSTEMDFSSQDQARAVLDLKANEKLKREMKSWKGYEGYKSHIRIASLIVEFVHDGLSLSRVALPEIDELDPAWKQEVEMREWLTWVPKRVVEARLKKGENEKPYLAPLEFIYTQKGLINEINLLQNLGKEYIILGEDEEFCLKCFRGLQGGERLVAHCEWDEYFTVFLRQ